MYMSYLDNLLDAVKTRRIGKVSDQTIYAKVQSMYYQNDQKKIAKTAGLSARKVDKMS